MQKFKHGFISCVVGIGLLLSPTITIQSMNAVHASETNVNIIVNNTAVEFSSVPIIQNGTTLVPMRAIFEAMGATVEWDQQQQRVTSQRDGNIIELHIKSNTAYVNGESHTLVTSPQLFNGRTLVPIRFIGESFGDTVHWDNATKTVSVTTKNTSNILSKLDNPVLMIDGFKVNIVDYLLIKEDISYLPLIKFLDAMNIQAHIDNKLISFTRDGNEFELEIGNSQASLNGELIELSNPIWEHNGELFGASRTLATLIGAEVNWDKAHNQLSFITGNNVFGTKTLQKESGQIARPINVNSVTLTGERRLLVSDNPESLYERTITTQQSTLWHDHIVSNNREEQHRVLGHHHNKFNHPITIGITIENLSDNELEIINPKGIDRTSSRGWAIYDIGMQLAGLTLNERIPSITLEKTTIPANETVTLDSFLVHPDHMIGFLHEFNVRSKESNGSLNYKIRTVMSQLDNSNLAQIRDEPVALDNLHTHTRGSWEQSTLLTELPRFNVTDDEKSYNISNRMTDNILTSSNSFDSKNSADNIGHYGATYQVKIPFVNHSGSPKTIEIRAASRGGRYAGAVKTQNGTYAIPTLSPMNEVVKIIEYTASEGASDLVLEFMHGSGSALPLAININVVN
ncbi:copper amine oxidase N-terminal domain-containing protein [Bacillus sp. FJAT-45350]|uniref:copper amine oxidase N-terminal domain-containing protein n=1 Tax=Bacillus sp. FJAT-45350 TaxID=2011014 RepID=UPI000BB7EEA8|nr:copper amine oxidase N-terminal domain-containing protein [Bacillus sp. FJAT-45350]